MSKFLSENQINFYKENGYLVVDDVLSKSECDLIIASMERHANKDFSAILNPDRIEFLIAQSNEKIDENEQLADKVKYLGLCDETSKLMTGLLKNKTGVGILETLYNSEMSGLMTQVIFKKAGSAYASQGWTYIKIILT